MISNYSSFKQITVQVVDEKGRPLLAPGNVITVEIEGKAKLKGIENSSLNDTTDYKQNFKKVVNGPLIVYVQSPGDNSTYDVVFTSPGLASTRIRLK